MPGLPLALGQIVISCLDWALAAAVLYVLLPQNAFLPHGAFLGAFLLATAAGAISHVPGGLGCSSPSCSFWRPSIPPHRPS